ncbi:hypothetical protein LHYA1_G003587, partial [Lachnellula hyalina]
PRVDGSEEGDSAIVRQSNGTKDQDVYQASSLIPLSTLFEARPRLVRPPIFVERTSSLHKKPLRRKQEHSRPETAEGKSMASGAPNYFHDLILQYRLSSKRRSFCWRSGSTRIHTMRPQHLEDLNSSVIYHHQIWTLLHTSRCRTIGRDKVWFELSGFCT